MRNSFILFLSLVYLAGCASNSPPSTTTDVCKIFKERYSWYKAAKKTEKRWKIPVYVSMAIIKQESSFRADARPGRFVGDERIDAAIAELMLDKRKVSLSIKLLEELQNKEAVTKFGSEASGKNLPFSSLSDKLKKKTEE